VNLEKVLAIMAKSYLRLANHFDELDNDHDGRVSPQQLVDALQGVGVRRQQALQ
jgi:Ca2+-binding EF-hand superfamily protein